MLSSVAPPTASDISGSPQWNSYFSGAILVLFVFLGFFFLFWWGGVRTSTQLVEKRSMAYVDKLILTFQIKSLFTKAAYLAQTVWRVVACII